MSLYPLALRKGGRNLKLDGKDLLQNITIHSANSRCIPCPAYNKTTGASVISIGDTYSDTCVPRCQVTDHLQMSQVNSKNTSIPEKVIETKSAPD